MVRKSYDAGVLTETTRLEVELDDPPSMDWKAYVVRARLEVLGVVSDQWSPYSRPICIHCQQCEFRMLFHTQWNWTLMGQKGVSFLAEVFRVEMHTRVVYLGWEKVSF